jgi:molecular chaperone GrpE
MSEEELDREEFDEADETEDFGDGDAGETAGGEVDEEQAVDYRDSLMRLQAEFENYKKRLTREREEQRRASKERVLKDLLPILDNLERAVQHGGGSEKGSKVFEGVELVLKQFREVLERFGIRPIEAEGMSFDPHVHDAMSRVETEGDPADGTVVEVYQKGYILDGRVLRPAMVSVAKMVDGGEED